MSAGWDDYDPAPCEVFHGELIKEFHEYRKQHRLKNDIPMSVPLSGLEFESIVVKAKKSVYMRYPDANKAIPKKGKP